MYDQHCTVIKYTSYLVAVNAIMHLKKKKKKKEQNDICCFELQWSQITIP
jgi:hypothetical protein